MPAADRCGAVTPPARHAASLPLSYVTHADPPICADVDGISIKTPAVQIWTICMPESSHEHEVLSYCAFL